jgi:hypothetical protein
VLVHLLRCLGESRNFNAGSMKCGHSFADGSKPNETGQRCAIRGQTEDEELSRETGQANLPSPVPAVKAFHPLLPPSPPRVSSARRAPAWTSGADPTAYAVRFVIYLVFPAAQSPAWEAAHISRVEGLGAFSYASLYTGRAAGVPRTASRLSESARSPEAAQGRRQRW